MKKVLLLIVIIFSYISCYSQTTYRIISTSKNIFGYIKYPLEIQRVTIVESAKIESIILASSFETQYRHNEILYRQLMKNQLNQPVEYTTQIIKQYNCNPEFLYGGYNYIKTCLPILNKSKWKEINYNEVHKELNYIINKKLLNVLYNESVKSYNRRIITNYPFLEKFINNSPAIYHQFKDNPAYEMIFNSAELQLKLYINSGIKGILDEFFKSLNILNEANNIEPISKQVIEGTYLETKLWCDYYGLKWE